MAEIIEMPKLSDTMTTGTLIKWLKNEGDTVNSGDMLAEVETDKATMELEAFEDGVLLKRYVAEGDQVAIGEPVAAIGEEGEEAPQVKSSGAGKGKEKEEKPDESSSEEEKPEEKEEPKKEEDSGADDEAKEDPKPASKEDSGSADAASGPSRTESGRIKASPLAKKMAADRGIDLEDIDGSGPGGRIVKADIESYDGSKRKKAPAPAPASTPAPIPSGEDKEIPVSNMRGVIARRLLESKTTIPHFYLETEVDMAPLLALRKSLNEHLGELPPEKGGVKFTVNDFILKACAEALKQVPEANSSWMEDKILQHGSVHLAFAVAVEDGLVTPTIREAGHKSLRQISADAKELIGKAKSKKLKPEEMSGSTFTVTNLGMFGITSFYGIINPPNAAILSVGATVRKPVVNNHGEIVPGDRMTIGLSGDHRVVDGAVGAALLQKLREILETPALMLV